MNKAGIEKKHQDGFVDLSKSSLPQLKELLERQNKILNNSRFINSLPDKGERIKLFRSKILSEIKTRDKIDETSELLSKLNLQNLPNEIEWTGKEALDYKEPLDSDDDSVEMPNPLQIIANHSGTQKSFQKIQELPEDSLITKQDIEDAKQASGPSYAQQMCKKYDKQRVSERFKPNQPKQKELAKSDFKSSSENVQKMLGKNWEVTSATPPVPIYGSTEMVTLTDSLNLQRQQAQRLKEIRLQDAAAKLQGLSGEIGPLPTKNLMRYRNPVNPADIFEETPVRERIDDENLDVLEND